ncbi:MAG: SNF2-related protein [bacterium]
MGRRMLFETPVDIGTEYERFLRKQEYKRAYHCLEKMSHFFPNDIGLLEEIVNLCVFEWRNLEKGSQWLTKLAKLRQLWNDYALLAQIQIELGHIDKARQYLNKTKELQKNQKSGRPQEDKKKLNELERYIEYLEWSRPGKTAKKQTPSKKESGSEVKTVKTAPPPTSHPSKTKEDRIQKSKLAQQKLEDKHLLPKTQPDIQIPSYNIPVKVIPFREEIFSSFLKSSILPLKESQLLINYAYLTLQGGFNELLCLNDLNNVEKYWYQIETVKKVLRYFRGRVLLCDEVGLGKTIEAGMVIKEYLIRQMVKNILILTPPSLVSQWKEELQIKFGLEFMTTEGIEFIKDRREFWKQRFIIASISMAKGKDNMPAIIEEFYDLVVVDEAHHLRNRTTLSWKLVNQIKKKFILLLTATPVQNNLIELFNLITLLNPGQFKTEKQFKKEYLKKGNLKETANKELLRELLKDVMIRNTRSAIDLRLPKRFATTMRLEPTAEERKIYSQVNEFLRKHNLRKIVLNLLLRELGSSPYALKFSLQGMDGVDKDEVKHLTDDIDNLKEIAKEKALIEILMKNPDEKKIIFTHFVKSMDSITNLLLKHRIPYVTFRGDMGIKEKESAIARFKDETPVLISTESGGEGRNLQFCNTIINFDLPWNPMRIEQRIGRLHRIGQKRDVFIFNLSIKDTIEDYIIEILDNKINMFEMVIGEIEPILGYVEEEKDFEEIIMEIWLKSSDEEELKDNFEQLGQTLLKAKQEYLKTKTLDNEIFGEDYEI